MRRTRVGALALATAATMAVGAWASQASALERFEPPDGRIYSGVSTRGVTDKYQGFLTVSAQPRVAIYNRFGGQGLTDFRWIFSELAKIDAAGMISWQNFALAYDAGRPGANSQSIARGDIDAYILARAADVRAYGKPLFIRMNWEMNGNWFPFSPYDRAGTHRPANATVHYRNAWRRTVELFRGGTRAEIDARLAALGLPGLTTPDTSVPATTNVAWVWCPNRETKYADRQKVMDYYPGDDYVDWVGVDWYPWSTSDVGHLAATAKGPNEVYDTLSAAGPRKPFMIGEWGMFGVDRPAFTTDMFAWIAARPMVKAQVYFNIDASDNNGGDSMHDSELQSYPASAAAFRAGVSGSRWIRSGAEVRDYDVPPPPPPPPPPAETAYLQQNGTVVMEAERADTVVPRSGKSWTASSRPGSVGGAVAALGDTGALFAPAAAPTSAPELRFRVRFAAAGTYRLAVRGFAASGSADSLHVGLDGVLPASADTISSFPTFSGWSWAAASAGGPAPATITVPSAGLHTVNVWAREDGLILDRIVIARTGTATPTGAGPAESPRG